MLSEVSTTTSGRLAPPFTAKSVPFSTAAGEVSADVTWIGGATLQAELTCGAASSTKTGTAGIYLSLHAPAGSCTLSLSEVVQTDAVQSYTIFVTHESVSE